MRDEERVADGDAVPVREFDGDAVPVRVFEGEAVPVRVFEGEAVPVRAGVMEGKLVRVVECDGVSDRHEATAAQKMTAITRMVNISRAAPIRASCSALHRRNTAVCPRVHQRSQLAPYSH